MEMMLENAPAADTRAKINGVSVRLATQNCYVRPVRRIGTEIRSGPVRSAVSDRCRTDLGPDRFDENFFRRRAIFKKKVWSDAVDFVNKSLKSEPSSRFLSRSKFENFACHFFGKFGQSSQDLDESDYNSIKSRDDRLNSPKSGMCIFGLVI